MLVQWGRNDFQFWARTIFSLGPERLWAGFTANQVQCNTTEPVLK
jgi:hypothetical protein